MNQSRLRQLLVDYATNMISKADLDELLDYVTAYQEGKQLDQLLEELLAETEVQDIPLIDSEALYQRIANHPRFEERSISAKQYWWWSGVAAAVLIVGGMLFFMDSRHVGQADIVSTQSPVTHTVTTAPSDRPLLHLADGRVIDLDSVSNGLLATEDGTQITLKGNELHYEGDLLDVDGNAPKNKIITPKGRQYQVILPDGSKMWLNTASTLTYPIKFNKDKREIEINGEAYFEVKKAKDWPFIVSTNSQQITVLGTHFNVSAYDDDEYTKTALVEGSVKVSAIESANSTSQISGHSTILKPGQQAVTKKGKDVIKVDAIDTEEAVSWKDNLFVFNNEEISEVMKKVSRWYDVEVEYLDGMAGKRIGGSIPRFQQLSELMDALEATGLLRYQMEERRIVIMR